MDGLLDYFQSVTASHVAGKTCVQAILKQPEAIAKAYLMREVRRSPAADATVEVGGCERRRP